MKNISIVGSGLAGLYAAKTAALHGSDVVVYEKKKDVGSVLKCGEMFTSIYGMPPKECITGEIKKWVFDFSSLFEVEENCIVVDLPEGFAVMTDRATHEKILYDECVDLGVEFKFDTYMYIDEYSFDDTFVIIATGSHTFSSPDAAKAVCYTIEHSADFNKFPESAYFKMSSDMEGYYWMFPKGMSESNVGVGHTIGSADYYKKNGIEDIIKEISPSFAPATYEVLMSGGGIIKKSFDFTNHNNYVKLDQSNKIYIGDAAGLINPMLCGGEHLAMISGILAGDVCSNFDSDYFIRLEYAKGIIDIISPEMHIGVMFDNMRKCLSGHEFYDFVKETMSNNFTIMNNAIINHIKKSMGKHIKIPEVSNNELKELI